MLESDLKLLGIFVIRDAVQCVVNVDVQTMLPVVAGVWRGLCISLFVCVCASVSVSLSSFYPSFRLTLTPAWITFTMLQIEFASWMTANLLTFTFCIFLLNFCSLISANNLPKSTTPHSPPLTLLKTLASYLTCGRSS